MAGVIVHSCHSSLGYLLQSTLRLAAGPFNTCSSLQRLGSCSKAEPSCWCIAREGTRMLSGFYACHLISSSTRDAEEVFTGSDRAAGHPAWADVMKQLGETVTTSTQVSWAKQVLQAQSTPPSSYSIYLPHLLTRRAANTHNLSNMPW